MITWPSFAIWGPDILAQQSWAQQKRPVLAKPSMLQRPCTVQVFTPAQCTHTGANPGAWALNLHCSTGGRTNGLWNPATAIPHIHQCVCVHQSDIILWICLTLLLHMTQVPRHAGPPYTAHDITKGHPSLAGTPPGHAHSAALSQVSVPTASPYRYPKGWEAAGGVSLSLCPPSSSLHIHCMFNLSICLFSHLC